MSNFSSENFQFYGNNSAQMYAKMWKIQALVQLTDAIVSPVVAGNSKFPEIVLLPDVWQ